MIHQVMNAALVSGPETLVLPNLTGFKHPVELVLLQETRLEEGAAKVARYAQSLGYVTHEFEVRGRLDFKAIRALARFWKKNPPKIIHAHGPKATLHALLARRMAFKMKKKRRPTLITTHHGVRANDQVRMLKLFEWIYEKAVIPYCDLCLTVCTSDKELLASRGIKPKLLRVHLNGVDREYVTAEERLSRGDTFRRAWRIGASLSQVLFTDIFLVGVVGRLAVEKQHALILQAFKRVLNEVPSAKLLCFGTGALEAELKQMTSDLGLEKNVFWMGYRGTIANEMAGFDVLLSLSSAEGLPINLIEAGWAGTPVVASAVDGVNDLIEDGRSGLLLPPPATAEACAAALLKLAKDKALARSLGNAFQTRVLESFSRRAWVAELEKVYAPFL